MTVLDEGRARARDALRAREQALLALPLRAPREVLVCVVQSGGAPQGDAVSEAVTEAMIAIDLEHVVEVVPFAATLPVPDAPAFHLGLLRVGHDVAGDGADVVPVIDLVARFEAGRRGPDGRVPGLDEVIVIVRADDRPLGLVVGAVHGVAQTGCPTVEPPAGPWSPCLVGVFPAFGRPVLWLEPSTLLDAAPGPR